MWVIKIYVKIYFTSVKFLVHPLCAKRFRGINFELVEIVDINK